MELLSQNEYRCDLSWEISSSQTSMFPLLRDHATRSVPHSSVGLGKTDQVHWRCLYQLSSSGFVHALSHPAVLDEIMQECNCDYLSNVEQSRSVHPQSNLHARARDPNYRWPLFEPKQLQQNQDVAHSLPSMFHVRQNAIPFERPGEVVLLCVSIPSHKECVHQWEQKSWQANYRRHLPDLKGQRDRGVPVYDCVSRLPHPS